MSSSDKLKIPLQEILSATNGFAEVNIIGKGGYGLVYQGQSKQHGLLAIKRLNHVHSGQGDHEYGMEVSLLSKYKHENLVSLIGYCGEGDEKILVYKYEANQSLDKFLHCKDLSSWMCRLHICLGAARGLRYLHDGTGPGHGIIHRDIKSSNILLDENWNAKVSDFGLSKIALTNSPDSFIFTVPCGTLGYVDPQILYGGITQKSDVYSFGVVLYEVLFGKLVAIQRDPLGDGRFTIEMAKTHYEKKTLHMMIDPDLRNQMNSDSLLTYSTIAYQCLEIRTEDRPTMSLVVKELERALGYQQEPKFLYDVYISTLRDETTYIVDCLCDALKEKELSTYKGNIQISRNETSLKSVLKQSRYFIIIFSRHFSTDYCNLDEVAKILKCAKERGNDAIPIFLDVDPSYVREQKGYIGYTMSKYNTHPRMGVWINALVEASNSAHARKVRALDFKACEAVAKEVAVTLKFNRETQELKLLQQKWAFDKRNE